MADTLWPVPASLHDIASLSKELKRAWVRWLVQHTLSRHAEMPKPPISGWPATGLDEAVTDSAEVTFLPPLQVVICLYDHKDFIAQDCCRVSRGWQLIIFSPDKLLQTEFLSRKEALWLQTRGASSRPAPCAQGNGHSHDKFPELLLPAAFSLDLFGLSFTSEEWNNTT